MNLKNSADLEKKILFIGIIISVCFLIGISVSRIFYPFDVGHYEAGIWAPSYLSDHGVNPYKMELSTNPPYSMAPYGIGYYELVGWGLRFFGFQFWFARIISVICVLICSICIAKLTLHFTGCKKKAMLGIFLFLSQFPIQAWIGMQRPDLLSLSCSLLGITIALTMNCAGKHLKILLLLLILAFFLGTAILTRQTSFLPVGVVAGWYFLNRQYSRLIIFIISIVSFLSIVLIGLNKTSDGGYFWQQWLMPSTVEKTFEIGLRHFIDFVKSPVTIGILFLWVLIWGSKKNQNKYMPYTILLLAYLIVSVLLASVTASRIGSNINYYLELTAVVAMITPIYILRIDKSLVSRNIYLTILIFIFLCLSFTGLRICRGEYFRWQSLAYFNEIVAAIEQNTPKNQPAYSDYPELIVAANRPYYFNDFVQYDGRSPKHQIIFNKVLSSGKLSAIITASEDTPLGYYRYQLSNPVPKKFYKVYLYLRKPSNGQTNY